MKVMQKPREREVFMVSSDCKKVQYLISNKRNYYTGVHSSKKALKIYCPFIFKGLPGTKTQLSTKPSSPHSERDPKGFLFFMFFLAKPHKSG